jgi:hypothetical protein
MIMKTDEKEKVDEVPSMVTLLGGKKLTVTYLDGTSEEVVVRQVAISDLETYGELMTNEPRMVEFLCRKPAGWVASLTRESAEEVVVCGDGINADFFARWHRRQQARSERLMPGVTERIQAEAARLMDAEVARLQGSSLSSPSSAGLPSNKPADIPSRS